MMTQRKVIDMIATEAAEASSQDLLVRRYRVHGICFVPTECTMIVEAKSPEQAVHIALTSNWKQYIDQNGGDDRSAFDWMPFAEELQSPNAPTQPRREGGAE